MGFETDLVTELDAYGVLLLALVVVLALLSLLKTGARRAGNTAGLILFGALLILFSLFLFWVGALPTLWWVVLLVGVVVLLAGFGGGGRRSG